MVHQRCLAVAIGLALTLWHVSCFASFRPVFLSQKTVVVSQNGFHSQERFFSSLEYDQFEDDEEDLEEEEEEEEEEDPYSQAAPSEFLEDSNSSLAHPTTSMDWGGALGTLRERIGDQETGRVGPSYALFREMTSQSPNEAISTFVSKASPQVVTAMSGAVSSLLGGLTNPSMGVETIVKASGERIGSLCFQLQMTGYMFRNAEYVLALKDLMNIHGSAELQDYRDAFDRLDTDGSGFIETGEIEALFNDVYGEDKPPAFEVDSFLRFFDANDDGRISWTEFEQGLGAMAAEKRDSKKEEKADDNEIPFSQIEEPDDSESFEPPEPSVSGSIEVELKDGTVIEVEAKDYIRDLKREAEALKESLRREEGPGSVVGGLVPGEAPPVVSPQSDEGMGGIATYIASLQGDVKSLTKGIGPEVLDAMKLLVDYVIDGVPSSQGRDRAQDRNQMEMEIPGTALQQLALWQLVLGYKLRESEATGEYLRLLE